MTYRSVSSVTLTCGLHSVGIRGFPLKNVLMDLSLVNILARESELEHPLVVCLVSAIPPL